jgi:hypothetical protein
LKGGYAPSAPASSIMIDDIPTGLGRTGLREWDWAEWDLAEWDWAEGIWASWAALRNTQTRLLHS